jgi:hypothetical protein
MSPEYSVLQLENALKRRKIRLKMLILRRKRLQKELAKLEKQIVDVSGAVQDGRKSRRRPKNAKTLLAAVIETLAKHKQGLTLGDLAVKVCAAGYKTLSSDFHNTLYQVLYHNSEKWLHDRQSHTYRLK